MEILLTAVNAKYIHSNLAVYSLKAYAEVYFAGEREAGQVSESRPLPFDIKIAEYTINQPLEQILMDLYRKKPDVLCFSCYLWNITYVDQLVREVHKVLPETEIWLGGPEVSWNAEEVLLRLPQIRGVIRGEGEETFLELVRFYAKREPAAGVHKNGRPGKDGAAICESGKTGGIKLKPSATPLSNQYSI